MGYGLACCTQKNKIKHGVKWTSSAERWQTYAGSNRIKEYENYSIINSRKNIEDDWWQEYVLTKN